MNKKRSNKKLYQKYLSVRAVAIWVTSQTEGQRNRFSSLYLKIKILVKEIRCAKMIFFLYFLFNPFFFEFTHFIRLISKIR